MNMPDNRRVVVIGAGPVGIEAALYARMCGLSVTVYEQGEVGEHLKHWGHVRMFTPWSWNVSTLGMQVLQTEYPRRTWPAATDLLTGYVYREEYLLPLANCSLLRDSLRLGIRVVQISPSRDGKTWRLLLEDQHGQEQGAEADVVLDCTGVYGQPRWLGEGDMPARGERKARPYIPHGVVDITGKERTHYAGRSVLVVGSGYSAASNVVALAALAEQERDTWTFWITHLPRGQPLPRLSNDPLKERDRLAARANTLATRGDGHVEYFPQTLLDEVQYLGPDAGFYVSGRCKGKPIAWTVDRVIASVGYRPHTLCPYLEHIPGGTYHILGAKSQPKSFLLVEAQTQIQSVFRQLLRPGQDPFVITPSRMKAA
jgi:hypothetical protein